MTDWPDQGGPPRRRRFARPPRRGVILSTAMLFVLPLVVIIGLALLQVILLRSARQLTEAASRAAVELAARRGFAGTIAEVHEAAGLVLGSLSTNYRTEREFFDVWDAGTNLPGSDGVITDNDEVAVGITIPQGLVASNYMGLLGAGITDLHIRSVHRQVIDTSP